ncbi:hypothetical protein OU994_10410 [Pseudoduganella sp. SL102]|uniref:hypothetical protein n=1 Tax=Pseudoduganella sp. SL102 TaxID=2995154 RepID=UPI00248B68B0|nr:hypothetical protein [Pseudoduganella sp. SL102]WBS04653.1 hypothetical protein OU994_10410 [Pseudoduganella sp. SL102]
MPTDIAELRSPYVQVLSCCENTLDTLRRVEQLRDCMLPAKASLIVRIVVTNDEPTLVMGAERARELDDLADLLLIYTSMPCSELARRVQHALLLPLTSWQPVSCDITDVISTVQSGASGRMFFATGKAMGENRTITAMRHAVEDLKRQRGSLPEASGTVIVVRSPVGGIPPLDLKLTYTEFRSTFKAPWHIQGLAYDGAADTVEVDILLMI